MTRRATRSLRLAALAAVMLSTGSITAGAQSAGQLHSAAGKHPQQWDIDARRSLVVTEQPILARFSFERVLNQLVKQSRVPGLTALELFQQWWDTQNPLPGIGLGRNCDTEIDAFGNPVLNSFPYDCRPAALLEEGQEATSNPFVDIDTNPGAYFAVGLFNRFDLAPAGGANCGQYRIVFGRRSGIELFRNRNLVIFEAVLRNPQRRLGLRGCKQIQEFWARLSDEDDIDRRAARLERFYFTGIDGLPPVIDIRHFGMGKGSGQVRSNQFLQQLAFDEGRDRIWNLREFKLILARGNGRNGRPSLKMVPVTVKENPFGALFSPAGAHPRTARFQEIFASQVTALAADTISGISIDMPDEFNAAQSLSLNGVVDDYVAQAGAGQSALRTRIESVLASMGSTLTADHIIKRAQAMSCAGCHMLNNNMDIGGGLVWPESAPSPPGTASGFVHVSERLTETVDGVTRFVISPALIGEFLPARKQLLDDFLNDEPRRHGHPDAPIGGRRVH